MEVALVAQKEGKMNWEGNHNGENRQEWRKCMDGKENERRVVCGLRVAYSCRRLRRPVQNAFHLCVDF